jgi:hypothetical protein
MSKKILQYHRRQQRLYLFFHLLMDHTPRDMDTEVLFAPTIKCSKDAQGTHGLLD